jgi:hypothetical protein
MIDQTGLGSRHQLLRHARGRRFAVDIHPGQHSAQTLEHDLTDEAAAIPAIVDNQRLLVDLIVELPDELLHAEFRHIGSDRHTRSGRRRACRRIAGAR